MKIESAFDNLMGTLKHSKTDRTITLPFKSVATSIVLLTTNQLVLGEAG